MPCRHDETAAEVAEREARERENMLAPYKEQLDLVTKMLCGLMTALSPITTQVPPVKSRFPANKGKAPGYTRHRIRGVGADGSVTIDLDAELSAWWRNHQTADARRKRQELAASGLAKLTPEERDALGLNDDD